MKRRGFAFILAVSLVMSSLPGCEREDDGETTAGVEVTTVATTEAVETTAEVVTSTEESTEEPVTYPESLDVQQYFEERAEILSVTPVKDAQKTLSEKDVVNELKERGFGDYPITTSYTIDGSYSSSGEASADSSEKHPIYEVYHVTSKNELWVITVIDGMFFAYPSSHNINHLDQVPIELSETKEIASYDSSTNSIYLTIPKETVLDVRVVDKIDAKTLESINLEEAADETK